MKSYLTIALINAITTPMGPAMRMNLTRAAQSITAPEVLEALEAKMTEDYLIRKAIASQYRA